MSILSRLSRKSHELPSDVVAAIEGAVILPREPDDAGPRTAVAMDGGGLRGAFVFSYEEAERRIRRRWPALADDKVTRAVEFLASRVKQHAVPLQSNKAAPWIHRY